jgi:hypothetical protein
VLSAPDPGASDACLMQGQADQAEKQQVGDGEPRVCGSARGIDNPGDTEEDRRDDGRPGKPSFVVGRNAGENVRVTSRANA